MNTRNKKRSKRRSNRVSPPEVRTPYILRKTGTYNVLSEEGLCLIEQNAERILQTTGMEFVDDPEILQIFKAAGCEVKGDRVRFEPGFCRNIIQATAPQTFNQLARNPDNTISDR